MEPTTTLRAGRPWPARLLRLAGWLVLGAVLLVVLILGLLALPPVRGALLDFALSRTEDRLPGQVTVDRIAWPKLARFEIDGLLWTAAGGDTLAAADRVALDVALGPLLARDVQVRELTVAGARADVPAIRAAFPEGDDEPGAATDAALPVRHFEIDSLAVDGRIRLDPERSLAADVRSSGGGSVMVRVATTTSGEPEVDITGTLDWNLAPIGVRLDLAGTVPGTEIERLLLLVDLPEGPRGPIETELELTVPQVTVRTHAVIDLSDGVTIALAPIVVQRAGEPVPEVAGRDGAVVVRDGNVEVTGVKLGSVLGEVIANATVQSGDTGIAASAELELDLVGPRDLAEVFASDLPESTRFDDLGAIRGTLRASFAQAAGANEFAVRLDLTETGWLEDARIDADGRGGSVEITRLKLAGELGALDGTATIRTGDAGLAADGELAFALPGPRDLAALFPGVLPESLRVEDLGDLQGTLAGAFTRGDGAPEFEVRLDLSETEWLDHARIVARGRDGAIEVDTLDVALEGLAVDASGSIGDDIDARVRLELPDSSFIARLPALQEIGVDLVLEATVRGTLEAPELVASVAGRAAYRETEVPVLVLDVATRADSLDVSLELPDGATYDDRTLDRVDLDATIPFPPGGRPGGRLPGGRLRLEAHGQGLGLTLGTRVETGDTIAVVVDTLGVRLEQQELASQGPFALRYDRIGGAVAIDDLHLEGALGRILADADWSGDQLTGDIEIAIAATVEQIAQLLPEASLPRDRGLSFALESSVSARGTPDDPVVDWTGQLRFGGVPELDSLVVALDLRAAEEDGTAGDRGLPAVRGISGLVVVRRPDRELLRATLRLPAALSLAPPSLRADPADTLQLSLRSEPIPLEEFAPLLPPGISLSGTLHTEADIRRPLAEEELQLSGFAELAGFRFDSDDGSWAQAGGKLTLSGTSRRPRVAGTITVDGGVIVLPEPPPTLLPVEGDAILWAEDSAVEFAAVQAEKPGAPEEPGPTAASDPVEAGSPDATGFAPEFAVIVDCPSSVHLRGRGLTLDLQGKLELEYREEPVIVGELRAVRGTFRFLGRQFEVVRGIVSFYGDPETDPALDLTLETRISGTTYRVDITGDAAQPKLELSSDPQMSDGDIVASIVFGKPLDELDSGQENLLQARMLAVLAQYGAESVSGDVTRALGVDMMSYDETDDRSGRSSLTIGKYLNPRTLVKYEQIIDREIAYLLRLEYTLTHSIRVETAFGQGTASGVDLQWSIDY